MRRLAWWGLGLLGGLALLLVAGILLLPRLELAGFAAGRLGAALGREMRVESLRVTPGGWLRVELRGLRLAGLPGEEAPMLELGRAGLEIELRSLLREVKHVRNAEVEGMHLRLGRDAAGRGNWSFGGGEGGGEPALGRANFPSLRELAVSASQVDYRTGSGKVLRVAIGRGTLTAPAEEAPAKLVAEGAYNDEPVELTADLGTLAELRDVARPYPATLQIASGGTRLRFGGGFTRPLDVDGAEGALELEAPNLTSLLALAGVKAEAKPPLTLRGHLTREGDLWVLDRATGRLGEAPIEAATLRLREGARGQDDEVAARLAFGRLDLDTLLRSDEQAERGADVPLAPDRDPGVRLTLDLAAREVAYGGFEAAAAEAEATLVPGKVAVPRLAFTYLGARVEGRAEVEAEEEGSRGRASADVRVRGMAVDRLKRVLGLGALPLSGEVGGAASVRAEGETLNAAAREARASAVLRMEGGSISQAAVELLSTDISALFRSSRARTNVSCLLAVVDMRGGAGSVAPLRLRTGEGTIVGAGTFDLRRETVDLTIASEARTTGALALDVPIRVRGSFADPSVGAGGWPRSGPPNMPAGIGRLIASLQPVARESPCAR